jgi:hypothetical protein
MTTTEIPLVGADPRVIAAGERLTTLGERRQAAERQLRGGSIVHDSTDRVARLLADPMATLTRAPAISEDDLRDLRAAEAEAERELERAGREVMTEFARAIRPTRRKQATELIEAAERLVDLLEAEIAFTGRMTGAGHDPVRLAFATDRDSLQRLLDRVRRAADTLSA